MSDSLLHNLPEGLISRPATREDVDAITAAQKAMDAVDHPDWTTPREDIEDQLDLDHVNLAADSAVVLDHEGHLVAWGMSELLPTSYDRVQVAASGGVVPSRRRRGIGNALLTWQLVRGREQVAAARGDLPAWIRMNVDERNVGARALATAAGMREERWFTSMDRDLLGAAARAVPQCQPPAGVQIVGYTADRAEDARAARDDSFRDHWGYRPSVPQVWQQFVAGDLFRADLSFLAVDEESRILGFALANANPEDWTVQGFTSSYLGIVGVIREARGRGVARALLSAYLRATATAELERAVLDVDTANPSGALGLYERMGFVASNRSIEYVLDL